MSYDVTASFSGEQRRVEGSYPVELYVINASQSGIDYLYYVNSNQDMYGYQLTNAGTITATEELYTGFPIQRDTVKSSISGEISELTVSVPNIDRTIESVIQSQEYLRGREFYILTTYTKFLPSGSSTSHFGSTPDKNAVMREKMYVDSTTSDVNVVTFHCKPKFIIKNIVIPRRKFSRECGWTYLSTQCDFSSSIDSETYPTCNYTLSDCRLRVNATRFGGFVSIPRRGIFVR